jgi:hypothetical protein
MAGALRRGLAAVAAAAATAAAAAAAARPAALPRRWPPRFSPRSAASSAGLATATEQQQQQLEEEEQGFDDTNNDADDPLLSAVLERARRAVGGSPLSSLPGGEAVAFGTGTHLGSRATWSLRFRATDGAIREELRSKHLSFVWGSPGDGTSGDGDGNAAPSAAAAAPPAWEVDPAGVTKALELDDREALLLAALLRSGLWLDVLAGPRLLHMRLAGGGGDGSEAARALAALAAGGGGDDDGGGAETNSSSSNTNNSPPVGGKKARRKLAAEARHTAARAHPTAAAAAEAAEAEAAVRRLAASVGADAGDDDDDAAVDSASSSDADDGDDVASSSASSSQAAAGASFIYVDVRLRGAGDLTALRPAPAAAALTPQAQTGPPSSSILAPPGLTVARVRICPRTFRPVGYSQAMCGEVEVWRFLRWRPWGRGGVAFPSEMHHLVGPGGSGGRSVYITRGVSAPPPSAAAAEGSKNSGSIYAAPAAPALPADASYAPGAPAFAQAYRAPSGHVLVAGSLSAGAPSPVGAPWNPSARAPQQQPRCWFLLDSGASGLVVDASAARRLSLPAIGELRVAGVAGRSRARLLRARELSVGPLTIRDPVLMEMDVAGLVRDLPAPPASILVAGGGGGASSAAPAAPPQQQHPVAGIVGYDLFRRAVVDIPGAATAPSPGGGGTTVPATGDPSLVVGDDGSSHSGFFSAGGGERGGGGGDAAAAPAAAAPVASLPALTLQQKLRRGGFVPVALRSPGGGEEEGPPPPLSSSSPSPLLLLDDDAAYEWLPMALVAYLPHVVLRFGVPGDPRPRGALFMLDTGASGADLMFHSRAAARLGLLPPGSAAGGGNNGNGSSSPFSPSAAALATPPPPSAGGVSFVRGVGGGGKAGGNGSGGNSNGGGGALKASSADLPWLQWGGLRLEGPVRALIATQPGGLDLSRYASGIACADLLGRAALRLDYRGRRVGLRRPQQGGGGGRAAAAGGDDGGGAPAS